VAGVAAVGDVPLVVGPEGRPGNNGDFNVGQLLAAHTRCARLAARGGADTGRSGVCNPHGVTFEGLLFQKCNQPLSNVN
jgi:hypothetical protein